MLTVRVSGSGAQEKAKVLLESFQKAGLPYQIGSEDANHGGVDLDGKTAVINLRIDARLWEGEAMRAIAPHIRRPANPEGIFSSEAQYIPRGHDAVLELTGLE